eukprot:5410834-Prymnesium_polylepis.1
MSCPLHPLPRPFDRTAIMLPLSSTLKPSHYLPSSSDSTSAATSESVSCICLGTQVRGTTDSV